MNLRDDVGARVKAKAEPRTSVEDEDGMFDMNHKKKCDENKPFCTRCTSLNRTCEWPSGQDFIDKRFGARKKKDAESSVSLVPTTTPIYVRDKASTVVDATIGSFIFYASETMAVERVRGDMDAFLARHFSQQYYNLLLNPDSHIDFHEHWITDIQRLMKDSKPLRYSVLANAASHVHYRDESKPMQELALKYYSQSVKGLSEALSGPVAAQDQNEILMSVMFLYLHGCMGRGTYSDIPWHLTAATQIIKVRFLRDQRIVLHRPFDRLAVESVLYQIFLVCSGSWASENVHPHFKYDQQFWLDCEALLARSTIIPTGSATINSPVLGVPCALFRLVMLIRQQMRNGTRMDTNSFEHLRSEISFWEAAMVLGDEVAAKDRTICEDATFLYIIIASLLFEQISSNDQITGQPCRQVPQSVKKFDWRLEEMGEILQRRADDRYWIRCFVATWPMYTAGFLVTDRKLLTCVRNDLCERWSASRFSQVARFRDDFEKVLEQRQLLRHPDSKSSDET